MMHSPASPLKSSISICLFTLLFLFLNVNVSPYFSSPALAKPAFPPGQQKTMAINKIKAMEQASGGPLKFTLSKKSGLATFLTTKPGREIPIRGKAFGNAKERAQSFLNDYGDTFGLHDPSEYRIMQDRGPDGIGMEHVRIQQLFKGIPITGGQLTVHMRGSLVTAVHAKTLGNIKQLQTSPTIDPATAVTSAKQIVKKYYDITNAVYSTPRLDIF